MELSHLKYFYSVAKTGSFTKASKALRVSQPAISKTVRLIEENHHLKLFDRTKKGVILTRSGEIFLERCENIFRELKNLEEEASSQNLEYTGVLKIAASDNLCNYVMPDLLFDFWKQHNKVLIQLFSGTSDAIKNELSDSKSEIGLFYTNIASTEITLEKITDVKFVIVCAPENTMLNRKTGILNLEKAYYIGSRIDEYRGTNPALRMLKSVGIRPRQFFEVNNHETQKKMAMKPWGYTIVPVHSVKKELKIGTLVEVKSPKEFRHPLYLVKRKGRTLSRTGAAFEDFLRQEIKSYL